MRVLGAGWRREFPQHRRFHPHAAQLIGDFAVLIHAQVVVRPDIRLEVVRVSLQPGKPLELIRRQGRGPAARTSDLNVFLPIQHLVRETFPLDEVDQMGAHIRNGLALLAHIEEPRRPGERFPRHFLEVMVDAHHFHRRLRRCALFQSAEDVAHPGQLPLENGRDLAALGHDVVQQDLAVGGRLKGLPQPVKVHGIDGHGLVGQDIETGGDGAVDVLRLAGVVAGNDHHVAGLVGHHAFEEVLARIDFLLPMRGLVGAGVEALDALEVVLKVRTFQARDPHQRADLGIHELLHQAGVEVPGVQGDQAHGWVGGKGSGGHGGSGGEREDARNHG